MTAPIQKSYGDWTVLRVDHDHPPLPCGAKQIYLLCKCVCGEIRSVRKAFLVAGSSTSCGCKKGSKIAATKLANKKLHDPEYLSQVERRSRNKYAPVISPEDKKFVTEEDMIWHMKYRNQAISKGYYTQFDPM